jgi:S-DNA-T family DNA segregation ATPase FtsK/SpoIIIE
MAKSKPKTKRAPKKSIKAPSLKLSSQQKLVWGSFLILLGLLLFIAFVSFLFTGEADQSALSNFASREIKTQNWLSKSGAWLSDFFIQRGFGIASFIFSGLIFLSGIYVLMNINKSKLRKHWFWGILIIVWLSILLGFFGNKNDILGGTFGFEINSFLQDYIGKTGTILLLIFGFITYLAIRFKVTFESIANALKSAKKDIKDDLSVLKDKTVVPLDNNLSEEAEAFKSAFDIPLEEQTIEANKKGKSAAASAPLEVKTPIVEEEPEIEIKVEEVKEEVSESDNLANKLVEDFGQFDPTLELAKYQFPTLDLLKKYDTEGITINQEELEENKNKIVETLKNYNIGIASIKATIGPTVTLYEIVPDAGIRISKIKNLEDDIVIF